MKIKGKLFYHSVLHKSYGNYICNKYFNFNCVFSFLVVFKLSDSFLVLYHNFIKIFIEVSKHK